MLVLTFVYLLIALVPTVFLSQNEDDNFKTIRLHIRHATINPDCFSQPHRVVLVNGQFPAPPIRVIKGDNIKLIVENDSSNNASTSIHVHGIRQIYSNYADGVPDITQTPIRPGEKFVYRFKVVDQTGTFFYHAHVLTQDETVQGPFIVYDSQEALENKKPDGPYFYDHELVLQWSEWWHQSLQDRANFYLSPNFTADSGPDSVLLNGQGVHPNGTISEDCKGFYYFDVAPNKVYRLRNIGGMTFRNLAIAIKDHDMQLIEIDGEYIKPYNLSSIEMSPGQRMSVLIRTGNHPPGSLFPILNKSHENQKKQGNNTDCQDQIENPKKEKVTGRSRLFERPQTPVYNANDSVPGWVLPQVSPWKRTGVSILKARADHTIFVGMREIRLMDNSLRFINNNRSYIAHPWGNGSASLLDIVQKNPRVGALDKRDGYSFKHHTYPVDLNQVVDFVFQNYYLPPPAPANICVSHPWHTHGYSHYLMAEGPGDYDPVKDRDLVTFSQPLLKDVSIAYPAPRNGSIGCGWTRVRILTDNPGVWAVHCHITAHMLQGKLIVLEVAPEKLKSTKKIASCD
ncbi:multicopper oxidase-domain-containing protein [Blakeslea trispora]|nr:multicopper oxidase-domain-containing protein [Blakeslea trispora]